MKDGKEHCTNKKGDKKRFPEKVKGGKEKGKLKFFFLIGHLLSLFIRTQSQKTLTGSSLLTWGRKKKVVRFIRGFSH